MCVCDGFYREPHFVWISIFQFSKLRQQTPVSKVWTFQGIFHQILCFSLDQDLYLHISCLKFFPFNFVSRMQCILHTKNVLKPWNEKMKFCVSNENGKKVDAKQVYWIKSRISYLIRWYKLQLSLVFFFFWNRHIYAHCHQQHYNILISVCGVWSYMFHIILSVIKSTVNIHTSSCRDIPPLAQQINLCSNDDNHF